MVEDHGRSRRGKRKEIDQTTGNHLRVREERLSAVLIYHCFSKLSRRIKRGVSQYVVVPITFSIFRAIVVVQQPEGTLAYYLSSFHWKITQLISRARTHVFSFAIEAEKKFTRRPSSETGRAGVYIDHGLFTESDI